MREKPTERLKTSHPLAGSIKKKYQTQDCIKVCAGMMKPIKEHILKMNGARKLYNF